MVQRERECCLVDIGVISPKTLLGGNKSSYDEMADSIHLI